MRERWVDTHDHLYWHFHNLHVRVLVVVPGLEVLDEAELEIALPRVKIIRLPPTWTRWSWETWHPYGHKWVENECFGLPNTRWRRNGEDGPWGGFVRGTIQAPGCADTPLMDVDRTLLIGDTIAAIREDKRPGERLGDIQFAVLRDLEERGLRVFYPWS